MSPPPPACFPNVTTSLGGTQEQRELGIALYTIFTVVFTLCFLIFTYGKYKLKLSRLRRRHTILALAIYIGCMLQLQLDILEMIITSQQYNCTVKIFMAVFVVPLFAGGIAGRLVTFYFRSRYEQMVVEARANKNGNGAATAALMREASTNNPGSKIDAPGTGDDADTESTAITKNRLRALLLGANELFLHRDSKSLDLTSLRYLQSGKVTMIFFLAVFVLPALIFFIALVGANRAQNMVECAGCLQTIQVALFIILQSAATMFFILGGIRRSWPYPDVFGILSETALAVLFCGVTLAGFVLSAFFPSTNADTSAWDYSVLTLLGTGGVLFVQTVLQVIIGYCIDRKQQEHGGVGGKSLMRIDNLEGGQNAANNNNNGALVFPKLRLDQVLQNEELSKQFEEHLAHEFAVESLYFLRDAQRWTKEYSQTTPKTRAIRARRLVNQYIRPSAVLAINLPYSLSRPILDAMEDWTKEPESDLFANAIHEIESLLERGALLRFSNKLAKARMNNGRSAMILGL